MAGSSVGCDVVDTEEPPQMTDPAADTSGASEVRPGQRRDQIPKTPRRRHVRQAQRAAVLVQRRRQSRYAMVYDTRGPKVRLGFSWFVAVAGAVLLEVSGYGLWALAVLYAAVAGVAGLQTARAWSVRREHPNVIVAGVAAAAAPLGAMLNTGLAGVAVVGLAVASIGAALLERSVGRDPVVDAGFTVRCGLFAGLAATSVVLVAREEIGAAIALLALVSMYEMGDFLVGSGSANAFEGPIAGMVGVAALSFGLSVIVPPPFTDPAQVLLFGGLVALMAPIGQLAASAILPRSGSHAPALRRVDSLIVVGPVWLTLLWLT